jgi:hypothetical protein
MPKILGRLRARRERIARETLERLDAESAKGEEAARRFKAATRQILKAGKRDA